MNRFFVKRTASSSGELGQHYIMSSTVLGSGSYAVVKLGQDRVTGKNVAIKIIDKSKLKANQLKKVYKEVEILKALNHKNVVRFHASYDEGDKLYIVMEYVTGGDLFERLAEDDIAYNENDVRAIIRSVLQGLSYCKDRGIIHRDMKPENVLLSADGEVKLADFNLSYQMDPSQAEFSVLQTMLGTPNYVAPEVLSGDPYSYKCDIWSTGVICYFLLSGGYLPFNVDPMYAGKNARALLLSQVKTGLWEFQPSEAWEKVSDEAKDFLQHAMNKNPEQRFSYDELLTHPWLKERKYLEVDEEEGNIITSTELARYNAKRKLLTVKNVKQAVAAFESLMKSEEFQNTASQQGSFLGSGIEAFKEMLDLTE